MPTIFSHPAIALGFTPWFKEVRHSKTLLFTGILLTILPDFDVIGLRLGIAYEHPLGHRGFTHSLLFAFMVSVFCTWLIAKSQPIHKVRITIFFFICMASHGILDALTDGGLGIAFLSPFSNERFFFPYQPIEVSPLNLKRFFEGKGLIVIINELKWIWLPSLGLFILGFIWKKSNIHA